MLKKNRVIRMLCCMLALLAAALVFVACGDENGQDDGNTITLTIWEDENNIPFVEDLLNNFISRDYVQVYKNAPTVRFKIIAQTEQRAIERLGNLGPTGNGPDVFAFVHNQIGAAAGSKWIAPAEYGDSVRAHHIQSAVDALSLDGHLYGYPSTAECMVLMYDGSQISEQAVRSLEGINAAGKKISWQIHNDAYYSFAFLTDANLFGPGYDDQTVLKLDGTQSVENLLYLYGSNSLARRTINSEDPDTALDSLRVGDSVGVVTTPYLWNTFKSVIEARGGTPKVAVLPTVQVKGETVTLRPYAGYKAYGVSAFTEYPHLSQALAHYLSTAESQYRRVHETHCLPTIKDSSELDSLVASIPEAQIYKLQLQNAFAMPNIIRMEDMWAPGESAMTNLYNNNNLTRENIVSALQSWQSTVLSKN